MKGFGKRRLLGFLSIAASVSIVVFLSRYSSRLPDGLESVAGELGLTGGIPPDPASSQSGGGTAGEILTALLGLMVILAPSLVWMVAVRMKRSRENQG